MFPTAIFFKKGFTLVRMEWSEGQLTFGQCSATDKLAVFCGLEAAWVYMCARIFLICFLQVVIEENITIT